MQHSIQDWLDLHRLKLNQAHVIVTQNPKIHSNYYANTHNFTQVQTTIDAALTTFIVPAFYSFFGAKCWIDETIRSLGVSVLSDVNQRPHIRDEGPTTGLTIYIGWRGTARDILFLAHEFGHAVQIKCSNHNFMPPMMREICAFCGEIIVLKYINSVSRRVYSEILPQWENLNISYYDSAKDKFLVEVRKTDNPYHYDLNYPLARLIAHNLFIKNTPSRILNFFSSGENAVKMIDYDNLTLGTIDAATTVL